MSANYERYLGDARELLKQGEAVEVVLAFVRKAGASPIDSIKVLMDVTGVPLAEAKHTVHFSEAWRDMRDDHEEFHERVIQAAGASGLAIEEKPVKEGS